MKKISPNIVRGILQRDMLTLDRSQHIIEYKYTSVDFLTYGSESIKRPVEQFVKLKRIFDTPKTISKFGYTRYTEKDEKMKFALSNYFCLAFERSQQY